MEELDKQIASFLKKASDCIASPATMSSSMQECITQASFIIGVMRGKLDSNIKGDGDGK